MSIFRRRTVLPEPAPAPPPSPPLIYNPSGGTRSHYARPDGLPLCGASSAGGWAGQGSDEERAWASSLTVCGLCRSWRLPA